MSETEARLCDATGLGDLVAGMARRIASAGLPGAPLRLVGIRSRGYPIASRLAAALAPLVGVTVPVGAVDITLYRDDLDQAARWPVLHGTDVTFDVEGADVVLVDDVLFSGRTVRAALNAVCDLGRPARVRLAVLVDRGHREVPIQPDVVGMIVTTSLGDRVRVRLTPTDAADEVVLLARP